MPYHRQDIVEVEGRTKGLVAHRASRRKRHVPILQMKPRVREAVEIARVIVVKMGQDHVGYSIGIHADQPQGIRGIAQQTAPAPRRRFLREPCIYQESAVAPAQYPDEVIEVGGELVRIGQDEVLAGMPVAKVGVADGEDFEGFGICQALSLPADAPESRNKIEMQVAAQQRQPVLPRQRRNPKVIPGYRASLAFQFAADLRISFSRRLVHGQHAATGGHFRKPSFITRPVTRLRDSISILTEDNDRDRKLRRPVKDRLQFRVAVCHGRQPVRIEYQCQSSGSIRSNSSSTIASIRAVSARKLRSLPNDFSHGLALPPETRSFSASASVTNSRRGTPRSAASDFARLKSKSGISRVVFIHCHLPIFTGSPAWPPHCPIATVLELSLI